MAKTQPLRMCIACRQMKEKSSLLRVVKSADGNIGVDFSSKAAGRGAYVCGAQECVKKLGKYKLLNKTFSADVPQEVYAKIEEEFFAKS